jgi:alpha-1,6-mannosyltransferase
MVAAFLAALWIGSKGAEIVGHPFFLAACAVIFAAMLVLWRLWPASRSIVPIIALALGIRACLLAFPASDDVNRYIWEGAIQNHGFNPFYLAPDSPELMHLRDANWQGINHKSVATCYGPVAQLLFRAAAAIWPVALFFKLIFLLFDCSLMVLLVFFVRRLKIDKRHIVLYALNPLALIYTAGEGHVEIVAVFWTMLALYWVICSKPRLMWIALGIAISIKLTPIVVLPFLIRKSDLRHCWTFFIPCMLVVPYLSAVSMMAVPIGFATHYHYNGLVFSIVDTVVSTRNALLITSCIACIAFGAVFFFTPNRLQAAMKAVGIFLLCSPTFHPWYLLLMTPFLVLFRPPHWIILHLTVLPLIFFYNPLATAGFWHDYPILAILEYLPFVIMQFVAGVRFPVDYPAATSISVVIPTLNEANCIASCLESLMEQQVAAQIIVTDGGSSDQTRAIVSSFKAVTFVAGKRGRGIQIADGIEKATGDIVIILHADTRLETGALQSVIGFLKRNPDCSGGAFYGRYDTPRLHYRMTEVLNNLRLCYTGIAFGDQAQFFRRNPLGNIVPYYKLMEDVELSLRIKALGRVGRIPAGVINSPRRWQRVGYASNLIKVLRLFTTYIVIRRFGLVADNAESFYRSYYGKQ